MPLQEGYLGLVDELFDFQGSHGGGLIMVDRGDACDGRAVVLVALQ